MEKPESWRTGKSPRQLAARKRQAVKAAEKAVVKAEAKKAKRVAAWVAKGGKVDENGDPYKDCSVKDCDGRIHQNFRRKKCDACIVNSKHKTTS